jgi:hypothetical protein
MKTTVTHVLLPYLAIVLGSLALPAPTQAQAPAWQAAIPFSMQPGTSTGAQAMAFDAAGDLYVAGSFSGSAVFGPDMVQSAGLTDIFLAKWSMAQQRFVWARRAGGAGYEQVGALAVNGSNIYLTGSFDGQTTVLNSYTLTNASAGGNDAFLTKWEASGTGATLTWATQFGTLGGESALGLVVDGAEVYVAGSFTGTDLTIGSTVLTNASFSLINADVFVARFHDNGLTPTPQWAVRAGGPDDDSAVGLAGSSQGLYLTGSNVGATTAFGSIMLTGTAQDAKGYLACLRDQGTTGTFAWAERLRGTDHDPVTAIRAEGPAIYLAGTLNSTTASFGTFSINNSGFGNSDAYLVRYTDTGTAGRCNWAQAVGGPGSYDIITALAVNSGQVYAAGRFTGSATRIGSLTLPNTVPSTADVFVARFAENATGIVPVWAERLGGSNYEMAAALAARGRTLYLAATTFGTTATLGSLSIPNPTGFSGGFLAVLDDITLATAPAVALPAHLQASPNPARGVTTLRLALAAGVPALHLTLTDALGRAAHSATVPSAQLAAGYPLDLTGLAPGLYLVRLSSNSTQLTRWLVVE